MADEVKVEVVPGKITSYATAVRAHLSAALAYMRVGEEDLMDIEFDSLNTVLDTLKKEARAKFRS